jgi:hypothetical protein
LVAAGSNIHLLLEGGAGKAAAPSAAITEEGAAEEAPKEATRAEEGDGSTPEIVPLSARTKEGLAELVKVIRAQPGKP